MKVDTSRLISVNQKQIKSMSQVELANLLTTEELKNFLLDNAENDNIDVSVIDAMLEVLAERMSEVDFAELCDRL